MNIYNLSRGIQNDITVSFNSFQITAIIYDHLCKDDCWNRKINQNKECKKKKRTLWIITLEISENLNLSLRFISWIMSFDLSQ